MVTKKNSKDALTAAEIKEIKKHLEELKAEGCNVVDVPDKTEWQEACAQVITDNTKGLEDLYQQLVDMA